jgi:ribosomal protein L32
MSFCSACGENIGIATICPRCGTAQESSLPQTKNKSQPPTYQTQTPYVSFCFSNSIQFLESLK